MKKIELSTSEFNDLVRLIAYAKKKKVADMDADPTVTKPFKKMTLDSIDSIIYKLPLDADERKSIFGR